MGNWQHSLTGGIATIEKNNTTFGGNILPLVLGFYLICMKHRVLALFLLPLCMWIWQLAKTWRSMQIREPTASDVK
jgi:hypothetical protein